MGSLVAMRVSTGWTKFLWCGYPQIAASTHQGPFEILCFDKGGRFFQGVKEIPMQILELNKYGENCHLPDKHLQSTYYGLDTVWDLGEMTKPVRSQFNGRDRRKQEMIREDSLGATRISRRGGSSCWGWGSQVKPSGGSWRTLACSSDYLSWGLHFSSKGKKNFHFQSLPCFSFTDSLGFNKMVKGKGSCLPLSHYPW